MKLRRFLAPLFVALALLVALLFVVAWIPLRQARAAWLAGRDADAIAIAGKWSRLRLWPSEYNQMLAAAELTSGRPAKLDIGTPLVSLVPKDVLARRLFATQRYDAFLAYDAASHDRDEAPDVRLYRVAALLSTNRLNEARGAFATIDRAHADPKKLATLQAAMDERGSGDVPLVYDRNGAPIAVVRNGALVAGDPAFAPLIDASAGALTVGAQLPRLGTASTIDTTLDPFVQHAALQALGKYRGSLVAIDPRTNEVLAIASSRGSGPEADLALERQYEPGSVVKVLTGLNAFSSGVDVKSMFPYVCKGSLTIDGRHFGDWVPQGHGTLNSIDDALAVSCNVYFADLGLHLGRDRLHKFMNAAGFDGQTNTGIMEVPLGKTVGDTFNNFETAFYAIGLQHETINAFHLAMLASMMANRGTLTTPRLLRARRSVLGEVVVTPPLQGKVQLATPDAAAKMIEAMQAVADDPRGTGRRAPVPGIPIAMKTGTAGERAAGLESVIMAFAPVAQPKIAFAIIGEGTGPAEYAGAKMAHDFVEAMKPRLQ